MTQFPYLFSDLAAPFGDGEVRSRQQGGRQVQYITARTAMNRLDTILGPENWWDEYVPAENSVLCRLTVRLPDGTTLTKADAGGYAGMSDQGDDDKSGFSDAFKRAAVKFGVGRYLYRDGVAHFAGEASPPTPPPAPAAPIRGPEVSRPHHRNETPRWGNPPAQGPAPPQAETAPTGKAPRSGRALFAWAKEQEQRLGVGMLRYLNAWAKLQEFPGRMVDWDPDQVALGHAEAVRKLGSMDHGQDPAYGEAS